MTEPNNTHRLKSVAAPAAGAVAIVASVLAVSIASGNNGVATAPGSGASAPAGPAAPGGLPGIAFDQGVPGAPGVQMSVEIVVKYKDDGLVKDIIDTFWRDQADARAKFEAFRERRSELAGLSLDRATYSNELVLVQSAGGARTAAAMREIAARLNGHADISYAEPNMTAHPGGQ